MHAKGSCAVCCGVAAADGPQAVVDTFQDQITELQNLVKFYEKKLAGLAEQHIIPAHEGGPMGPSENDWILEDFYHGDEAYLLDRKTAKIFTVPGENQWPRPVGTWMSVITLVEV